MFLLDTNVVSELRKAKLGRADARVVAWASAQAAETLFLSTTTIFELALGVLRKERADPAQGRVLRHWFDELLRPAFAGRILPIDEAIALRCAALFVPDPAPERDAFIAATALECDFTIVTRNVRDFERTGAKLLNPWEVESGSANA
jgi:predicted nucleic acid-binding protein